MITWGEVMKFGHNFCADISELITRFLSHSICLRKQKEIIFSKLDDVYYKMLEADADTFMISIMYGMI